MRVQFHRLRTHKHFITISRTTYTRSIQKINPITTFDMSEGQKTTVAIAGFTGRLARLITDALLRNHPDAVIHGICRSPQKVDAKLKSDPSVKVFQASSDDSEAIKHGVEGAGVCICCYLGDNNLMVDGQKVLIDARIASNVPRNIASDWCIDYRGLGDLPSKDPMIYVRKYTEDKEKAGQISGVHVLNGALTE